MEDQLPYQDFDLLIEPAPRGRYRARVLQSPTGESGAVLFKLPFSPVELENLAMKVSRSRRGTRGRRGRPEVAPLKDFGGKLYDAVFQDELRDTLSSSLSRTRAQQVGLRLRLRLNDAPALAGLPWEFLYDGRRFLAQSRHTPLVRYLDLQDPPPRLAVHGPLRLLVMISNPRDWPELDVEREWRVLTGALARPQSDGRVVVERMTANMSTLRQRLRNETFHVFHFVGHGYYRSDWRDGVLVMEDSEGGPHEVTGEELGGLLNEYDPTRLAVLNACEGALADDSDPFAGMAQSLIQQGLPAVVAMQFEITDDAAIIFARELYGAIADGFQLEAALAEARGAIRDMGNLTEWGTPVLYSRAPDGRLFDLSGKGRIQGTDHQPVEDTDHQAPSVADSTDQAFVDEIAAMDPYDAADALTVLPASQMAVTQIEVIISPDGDVTMRRSDGAHGPRGVLGVQGLDGELIRVFERWLSDPVREWQLADIRAFGGLLHRALFSRDCWRWVEQSVAGLGPGDRIRLQLAFPSGGLGHLAAIPWEYLRVPDRAGSEGYFLATDGRFILTRYLPMEQGPPQSVPAERVKALVLVSQPDDPTLGEVIAEPVLNTLADIASKLPVDVTVLHQPTRGALGEALAKRGPDIIQFIGHGLYDEAAEQGRIALVDEFGRADWVGGAVLAQLLEDEGRMPKLVFLHSCSGAQTNYRASFAGIAPRLIRRGTQCVAAMQYAVTNRSALVFSKGFYAGLAAGLPLDEAVQAGRRSLAVHYENEPRLLGIPVVYLNSRDPLLLPQPGGRPASPLASGFHQ